jgi:hypothetical protein
VNSDALTNSAVRARNLGGLDYNSNSIAVPGGSSRAVSVTCRNGGVPISGGGHWDGADNSYVNLWLLQSEPTFNNGWIVRGGNPGTTSRTLVVGVYCLV